MLLVATSLAVVVLVPVRPAAAQTAPTVLSNVMVSSQADAINTQAVQTKTMPLGNVTRMTQAERALLGRWIAQGAKIP